MIKRTVYGQVGGLGDDDVADHLLWFVLTLQRRGDDLLERRTHTIELQFAQTRQAHLAKLTRRRGILISRALILNLVARQRLDEILDNAVELGSVSRALLWSLERRRGLPTRYDDGDAWGGRRLVV